MSKNRLTIFFDREEPIYCPNEPVSGKVVVEAANNFSSQELWVVYGWRTHGWGNTDKGGEESFYILRTNVDFHNGDQREFPFEFMAPGDPATYHGHYVNIDWYLKATMLLPRAQITSDEVDFLLVGRESRGMFWSGDTSLIRTNLSFREKHPSISSILYMLLSGGLIILVAFLLSGFTLGIHPAIWIAWIGFLIALAARKKIFNLAFKLKINIEKVQVEPPIIHPGDVASCQIKFLTKIPVYLDHIAAVVRAEEGAVSGGGTRTQSHSFTVYKEQYIKPYGEELMEGRMITYDCPLPIPANAPPTFGGRNNSIKWSVQLKIACKRWPSWERTLPITISPC